LDDLHQRLMHNGCAATYQSVSTLHQVRMICLQSFLFSIAISTFVAADYAMIHSLHSGGFRDFEFSELNVWNPRILTQFSRPQLWQCSAQLQIRLTRFVCYI
jgi:hypothetical protein